MVTVLSIRQLEYRIQSSLGVYVNIVIWSVPNWSSIHDLR